MDRAKLLLASLAALCIVNCSVSDTVQNHHPIQMSSIGAVQLSATASMTQDAIREGVAQGAAKGEKEERLTNVSSILLTIKEIHFIRAESAIAPAETIVLGPRGQQLDLMALATQFAELVIGDGHLPVGQYTQIRLILEEENKIIVDGMEQPLKVPSAQQSGLKIEGEFLIRGGRVAQILLDFDVTHSIIFNRGQGYILKPVIEVATVEEDLAAELLIQQPLGESYTSVIDGRLVSYEIRDGFLVTEGDIVIGTVAEELSIESIRRSGNEFLWPGGIVPFTLDVGFSVIERESILAAMSEWEQQCSDPNVRFVQRSSESDFVHFRRGAEGTGCFSSVGRIGGEQIINLEPACIGNRFVIAHEIAHALGMWHEQSREDRNSFVVIHFENILPGKEHNFGQHISDGDDIGGYDYDSVMHYDRLAFSRNGQPTIEPVNRFARIGHFDHLSMGDALGMGALYGACSNTRIFRWWNATTRDHFYTADPAGEIAPQTGYVYEGVGFRTFTCDTPGTSRIFRWWNASRADHFYTTDPSGELAPISGYVLEGDIGCIAASPTSGTVALHRWWNAAAGDHFYTIDPGGELAPVSGYEYEGIAGHVLRP